MPLADYHSLFKDIRVISFDLDDTLWPCAPVIQRAEEHLYSWLTQHAPDISANFSIQGMREHRLAYTKRNPELAHDLTRVRRGALRQLMENFGYPGSLAEHATQVFRNVRNQVQPYPEVQQVLARLSQRYILVSVTNGNVQIHKTSLSGCFRRSFTAAEAGAARPDPALFNALLDWSREEPGSILHVGDDPARDVEAARSMGFRTAHMQRSNDQVQVVNIDHEFADVTVRDLYELEQFLTSESASK